MYYKIHTLRMSHGVSSLIIVDIVFIFIGGVGYVVVGVGAPNQP
jgi:hypothetical protein